MKIILSPAKTFAKDLIPANERPYFEHEAIYLYESLKRLDKDLIKKKMKLSDKLLLEVSYFLDHFNENRFQAITSYYGQVFKQLDYQSLTPVQKTYIEDHFLILSGLYGILRPLDGISLYRLEMQDLTITNLYDFWRPRIKTYIENFIHHEPIINLASEEYVKVMPHDKTMIHIDFIEIKNNQEIKSSMHLKTMRGLFARYLAVKLIEKPEDLKRIIIHGFHYDSKRSDNTHFVFIKE